jgi:predicted RNase H-like HicB family nuclease
LTLTPRACGYTAPGQASCKITHLRDVPGLRDGHHTGVKNVLQEGGEGDPVVPVQDYKYEIDIFWSDEDRCFIACVPDLDNCAAWGDTYEEALNRAHLAIRADLVSRQTFGDPIPEVTPRILA